MFSTRSVSLSHQPKSPRKNWSFLDHGDRKIPTTPQCKRPEQKDVCVRTSFYSGRVPWPEFGRTVRSDEKPNRGRKKKPRHFSSRLTDLVVAAEFHSPPRRKELRTVTPTTFTFSSRVGPTISPPDDPVYSHTTRKYVHMRRRILLLLFNDYVLYEIYKYICTCVIMCSSSAYDSIIYYVIYINIYYYVSRRRARPEFRLFLKIFQNCLPIMIYTNTFLVLYIGE